MKTLIVMAAAAVLATGASAGQAQTASHNPAVKDGAVHQVGAPAKGHSSFTEAQAKGRLAKAGFSAVSDLKRTNDGAWQGTATKDGKSVAVTLDYKGNVTTR